MKGRPSSTVVTVLVLAALAAAGVSAMYAMGILGAAKVSAESLERVLIVAASPDEDGSTVGQVILILHLTDGAVEVEPVSPALPVTIPGTSYETLGDAYPFGGGAGTSAALARALGEEPLPFVAIGADAFSDAIEGAGGVRLSLPAPVSVFDGDRLYSFKAGEAEFSAEELRALLKGVPYLSAEQRERLDPALGEALLDALDASPQLLDEAETNLDDDAMGRVRQVIADLP